MKKFAILLTILSLIACIGCVFCACDEDVAPETETVTITVYEVGTGEPHKSLEITQEKGKTYCLAQYVDAMDRGMDGTLQRFGFFLDEECTQKFDEENAVMQDVQFYVISATYCSKVIHFIFDNHTYCYLYSDGFSEEDKTLTIDSFVKSAYGKEIDSSKLCFFADEELSQQIDIVGKTFSTLDVEISGTFLYTTKNIYVKLID